MEQTFHNLALIVEVTTYYKLFLAAIEMFEHLFGAVFEIYDHQFLGFKLLKFFEYKFTKKFDTPTTRTINFAFGRYNLALKLREPKRKPTQCSIMKKYLAYPIAIAVCLAVGYLSSLLQADALREWYPTIVRSPLSPPNMVFPIVWGVLYVLMGVSLGECFRTENMRAVLPWVLQLAVNVLWTFLFFWLRDPLLGMVAMLLLIVLTIWYMSSAGRTSSWAAWLMMPYMLWLIFATYLNWYVYANN